MAVKDDESNGKSFQKKNAPERICCDANTLPFAQNSLPFVFCFETLHHFPDPTPVVHEIYRVLCPGGWFYFNEEPFKKVLYFPDVESSTIGHLT